MKTRSAIRRESQARDRREIDRRSGEYDGAMFGVRAAVAELDAARRNGATTASVRAIHRRIDDGLGRAAKAAVDVHARLLEAAGGTYHGETDADVIEWKRRLNTALTLRSQHQMSQSDDEVQSPLASVRPNSRAAFGPHQAGMESDDGPLTARKVWSPLH